MSFKWKTILGIFIIEFIMLGIIISSSINFIKSSNEAELVKRAHSISSIAAITLKDAVISNDLATIESYTNEMIKDPGLVYIRILDDENRILSQKGDKKSLSKTFQVDSHYSDIDDEIMDSFSQISEKGYSFGRVELGISTAAVSNVLFSAVKNITGIAVLELFLVGLFSFILGNYLSKQINRLKTASDAISKGNLGYQIHVHGKDDIAETVKTFNRMSKEIFELNENKNQQLIKLSESEAKMSAIIENSDDIIISIDQNYTVLTINTTGIKLLNIYWKVRIEKGNNLVDLIPSTFKEKYKTRIDIALSGKKFKIEDQFILNNEILYNEISFYPIYVDNGINGVSIMSKNITEYKRLNEELLQHKLNLEKLVFERTVALEKSLEDLQAANEELEESYEEIEQTNEELNQTVEELDEANFQLEKTFESEKELNKLKDEFVTNVNHELKTPLSSILLTTKYLLKRIHSLELNQIEDRIKRIDFSGHKLLELVNEILDFARLKKNAFSFQPSKIHLNSFLEEIGANIKELFDVKGIELKVHCIGELYIQSDKEHLMKIINNLLSNALKFTENGYVSIEAEQKKDYIYLSVVDTGQGIEEKDIELIFDRFQQLGSISNKAPGTGIGLHMVKSLTEKHGGKVFVKSQLDAGSRFTIMLPLKSKWRNTSDNHKTI